MQRSMELQQLRMRISLRNCFQQKLASYEYLSKTAQVVTKGADIQSWNSDSSVQKSSIIKSIYYGASKQEVDRTSRPKEKTSTIVVHFNINLNDGLRERLTNFE
ncbi:MAG: hypothetical protein EZS28_016391 [Streblomastix strix]|uniref:Uncharacterized protein n=2 Tax=Streblomastix strix TaxID=222440 RepID=A0A5J4VZI1_9EUKA|nr:MAG: hypothetical protein EZS28_016391 [Streblomastix strix]